ncbi:MAG TPA: hypothetical protein DCP85_13385, partial [Elusimicrobia bacterium]|nr:hypothetical protein [Elusimicrobiota bacterium]
MKNTALWIACLVLPASSGYAQSEKRDLLQFLSQHISTQVSITENQRQAILAAVTKKFADRGHDAVEGQKLLAAQAALDVIVGAPPQTPADRIAAIALPVYTTVGRGTPEGIARGIALYGLAKDASSEEISSWINAHEQMTFNNLPPGVAAEAVRNAIDNRWDAKTLDTIKWGLLHAVKTGFDPRSYSAYVFARMLQDKSRPGAALSEASAAFSKARANGKAPKVPPYEGLFIPFIKPPEKPKAEAAAAPEEKAKTAEPAPAQKPEEKTKPEETVPAPKPKAEAAAAPEEKAAEPTPAQKPEEKTKAEETIPAPKPKAEAAAAPEEKAKAAEPAPA